MNNHLKLVLAVLAGVSIGVAGAAAIHAQQTETPPGYVIAEVEVTDPTTLQKYGEGAANSGVFQWALCRSGRRCPGSRGRTAKGLHRGNRFHWVAHNFRN